MSQTTTLKVDPNFFIGYGTKMNRPCNLVEGTGRCKKKIKNGSCPAAGGSCIGRKDIPR